MDVNVKCKIAELPEATTPQIVTPAIVAGIQCVVCGRNMATDPFQAIYHTYLDVVTCHEHQNDPRLQDIARKTYIIAAEGMA